MKRRLMCRKLVKYNSELRATDLILMVEAVIWTRILIRTPNGRIRVSPT